jgi:myo-inositol-1-phosphate synthase
LSSEQQGGQKIAAASKIAPAKGKLGVMVVGLGAVATTIRLREDTNEGGKAVPTA